MIYWLVIAWFSCGLIGAGFLFADMQQEGFARTYFRRDMGVSILFSFFGPAMLLIGFLVSGFGESGWWIWGGSK